MKNEGEIFFYALCATFSSMQVLQPPNLVLLPLPLSTSTAKSAVAH